jgi:hypothetical protein
MRCRARYGLPRDDPGFRQSPPACRIPPPIPTCLSPPSGPRSMIWSAVLMTSMMVFDNDDRVAAVHQPVQHGQQFLDIVRVQTGCRFVKYVDGTCPVPVLAEFSGQFDTLRLPAGQGCGRLSDLNITDAHIHQGLEFWCGYCVILSKNRRDWLTVILRTSVMVLPLYFTSSVSRLYLFPWQASQGT